MSAQIENIKHPVIRKLAVDAQHKHTGDFGMTVYGGVDLEKFARLLVNECIEIVEPCKCGCWYGEPEGIIADVIIKQINKHFWVEE
jgi:hypothetical protein